MSLTQEPAHRYRRRTGGLVVLAAAAAAAVTATALLVIPAMAEESKKLDWTSCEGSYMCANLAVPLDWNYPKDDLIQLRLMKRPASGSPKLGTMVFNPGGPGTAGADVSQFGLFDGELAKHFDIVGFNPRGVNNPDNVIQCSMSLVETLNAAASFPVSSEAQFADRKLLSKSLEDSCRQQSKPTSSTKHKNSIIDYADTASTIRDIEELRQQIGEKQLNFYGMSYGTLMAQQYVEKYPDNVGSIVADSNMDHSVDMAGWFATAASATQDIIDGFVKDCGSTSDCYGSFKIRLDGSETLDSEDAKLSDGGKIARKFVNHVLKHAALGEVVSMGRFSTQAKLLDTITGYAESGNGWQVVSKYLLDLDGNTKSPDALPTPPSSSQPEAPGTGSPIFVKQSTLCQDWNLGVQSYSQWVDLHGKAKTKSVPSVRTADMYASYCLGWTGKTNNPPHKFTPKNGNPILIVNSRYDGATGYNWATSLASQFGNKAALLTYTGSGHITMKRSSCVKSAVEDFMVNKKLPKSGQTCAGTML